MNQLKKADKDFDVIVMDIFLLVMGIEQELAKEIALIDHDRLDDAFTKTIAIKQALEIILSKYNRK